MQKAVLFSLTVVFMSGAWADGIAQGSLLQRYGVSSDDLPKAAELPEIKDEKDVVQFNIAPEEPFVTFKQEAQKELEVTGNPSIDAMRERDRRNCQNLREEVQTRSKGKETVNFNRYVPCP